MLWQSREQVTHLSKGYSERYHSVRSLELQALGLSLFFFFFPLSKLEIKISLWVLHIFLHCALIFFASVASPVGLLCPLQTPYLRFSVRTFLVVPWHVGGPDVYHENKLSHTSGQQLNKTLHIAREAKFHSLTSVAFSCFCFTLR